MRPKPTRSNRPGPGRPTPGADRSGKQGLESPPPAPAAPRGETLRSVAPAPGPRPEAGRDHGARSAGRGDDAPESDRLLTALLPLRAFLGLTFLYAGLDKLLTPAFLREGGAGSIAQQLQGFTHASPLTPLIQAVALPHPIAIGLLMALAEIAVGLGAVLGLLYRPAAVGGAATALLFWLTASWSTAPYYYGPDLPYAAGWLTLAFVGRPGRFALDPWFAAAVARADERWRRRRLPSGFVEQLEDSVPVSEGRRGFLKAALLGVGAVGFLVGGGVLGRILRGDDEGASSILTGAGSSAALPTPAPSDSAAAATPGAGATPAAAGGNVITTLAELPKGSALPFQDPSSGDPAVVVHLGDGNVVAYDAVCTHQGCTVGYDPGSSLLVCPCHGAAFDPAHQAAVVGGPTNQPLSSLPIKVDQATGRITLAG